MLELTEEAGWVGKTIEVLALQTVAFHETGEQDRALVALEKALSLAEPGGYVRTFLDEGDPMGDLLERAVLEGVSVDYARSLLGAFESPAPIVTVSSIPGGPAPAVEGVEPLSRRELDVLKYLATELTGPEIARELMVSLNTMRTHTKNIYAKLAVNNRRSAVRKARELNLV
jgi:LuxR family maltose regulon positive regulatory protein